MCFEALMSKYMRCKYVYKDHNIKKKLWFKKTKLKIVHMISVEMIAVLSWNTPFHITHNDLSL